MIHQWSNNHDDKQHTDLQRASDWLSAEVEFKVSRKFLVGGAVLVLILVMIAFD